MRYFVSMNPRGALARLLADLFRVEELRAFVSNDLPLVPDGGGSAKDEEKALAALAGVGLDGGKARARASLLSGGERQRAAIVRALIREPKLLLLDEPTAHLDQESARGILALLRKQKEAGRTIVVSTHDPRLAADEIDRVIELRDGVVV